MKIFKIANYGNQTWSAEGKLFVKAFTWTSVAFLAICLIGFSTNQIIDQYGLLKGLADVESFDWAMYQQITESGAVAKLAQVSMISMILIFVSFIIRIVWTFKVFTASKTFIYINYAVYVVAQGLGFGILFTTWKAQEILIVFGVAGFLFGIMALAGWKAKRLENLTYFLIAGTIAMMVLGLFSMILFFTGVYSEPLIFVYFLLAGFLTLGYIVFDVAMLRRYASSINAYGDSEMEFRIASFFGFRLLTDLVNLIYILLRMFLYTKD